MANRRSFVDFCEGLLHLDPLKRWSPQQAAKHPFITGERSGESAQVNLLVVVQLQANILTAAARSSQETILQRPGIAQWYPV